MPSLYRPQHVWIDRQVVDSPITANVVRALPGVPVDVIDGSPPLPQPADQAALMTLAKKHLYLTAQQGRFVRDCPGASSRNAEGRLCCGYVVVDTVSNCNFDCTYCYLQSYINTPYLTVYANIERLFGEIEAFLHARPHQLVRMGSGEFSDSLSLDPLTGFSSMLVPFIRRFSNVLFELKTKSDLVEGLLDEDPQDRVMVSWSINPQAVVQREEHRTAPLAARLQAARRCLEGGYKIGLHFDPLLHFPGWEKVYEPFVEEVFQALDPQHVTTLSMGSLRFAPDLKDVVRERFPKSRLMTAELFLSEDGKMRYFRPIRADMYAKMWGWIRRYAPDATLYLCMETQSLWRQTFGHAPSCSADVEQHIQTGKIPLVVT